MEQWFIVVCDGNGKTIARITPPSDRIWADPFPVSQGDKTYIFLEEQYHGQKGRLGYIELNKDYTHSPFKTILEKSYHLSWPNVFSVGEGEHKVWYMIPESGENRTVDLYKAISFPDTWEFCLTLLSGFKGADPEVYKENDVSWWLFVSGSFEESAVNRQLLLFHSNKFPSSSWKQIRETAVVTGIERSRMAGKIFCNKGGDLIRPAQSCVGEYGEHIVFHRIDELSENTYREQAISAFYPTEPKSICTHTWNSCGDLVVRDEKRRWFSFKPFRKGGM